MENIVTVTPCGGPGTNEAIFCFQMRHLGDKSNNNLVPVISARFYMPINQVNQMFGCSDE